MDLDIFFIQKFPSAISPLEIWALVKVDPFSVTETCCGKLPKGENSFHNQVQNNLGLFSFNLTFILIRYYLVMPYNIRPPRLMANFHFLIQTDCSRGRYSFIRLHLVCKQMRVTAEQHVPICKFLPLLLMVLVPGWTASPLVLYGFWHLTNVFTMESFARVISCKKELCHSQF